ncbi:protein big brother-like [Centruroides vittatus]|uniref:protein big brother-like n=1 Tax=Centruroides sculpturatus TaxID=218467 RepID=UPI000C6D0B01|nr:protein big brother-like [Centruroides sculpturatus]
MLPYETPNIFKRKPIYAFRVVPNQKEKFETNELFRKLSHESEVRYIGYRDKVAEERKTLFQNECREGSIEVSFIGTGTNIPLKFRPCSNGYSDGCDFDIENGKVHIRSRFIMDGVCVRWRGWLNLDRLDGMACLEYDEERAQEEHALLIEKIERNQYLRSLNENQLLLYRTQQELKVECEMEARRQQGRTESNSATSTNSN